MRSPYAAPESDPPYYHGDPNRPWRWFGSCEDPCAEVDHNPVEALAWRPFEVWPPAFRVAPHCHCDDSRLLDDRCVDGLGRDVPRVCCDTCPDARLTPEGECILVASFEDDVPPLTSASCCEACREATWSGGVCRRPDGSAAPQSCCDCYEAQTNTDGLCVGGEGQVVYDGCCDCSNATTSATGGCVDALTGREISWSCYESL